MQSTSRKKRAVEFFRHAAAGNAPEADRIGELWDVVMATPEQSPHGHGVFR